MEIKKREANDFLKPRYIEALELRKSGMTYRQIGSLLDVTGQRARDMVHCAERRIENHNKLFTNADPSDVRTMPVQYYFDALISNALLNNGVRVMGDFKNKSWVDVAKMHCIGKKSMKIIEKTLEDLGLPKLFRLSTADAKVGVRLILKKSVVEALDSMAEEALMTRAEYCQNILINHTGEK